MADRNEADALFATKRKKQQEEQAEQERREEMSRKKAEMEAEIRRLEEEARRQKKEQEEARRQAEEEARRVKEEAKEAEARAARAEEMAKQAQLKQEEVRREEERRARERATQEEAQRAEDRKREASERKTAKEIQIRFGSKKVDIKLAKKLPVLPLAIGGAAIVVAIVICLVLFRGGKKGDVFGTDCDQVASGSVLDYFVFYPESFEEGYADGGVLLKHGSVDKGDFSFVYFSGYTKEDMEDTLGSMDSVEILHALAEYTCGVTDMQTYEITTDLGQTVYCTEYFPSGASGFTGTEEETMVEVSMMLLPKEDEYLVALYGTMKTSYEEPLKETVTSILDYNF